MKRINRLFTAWLMAAATIMPALSNETFTLYEDTHLSNTVPINNVYLDVAGTRTQVIYPAADLIRMNGEVINSMTFYADSPITVCGGSIEVSVGETDKLSYTDVQYVEDLTHMATISMQEGATEVVITFETPYYYKGGNLVFESIVSETASDYCYTTYQGIRPSNYSAITRGQIPNSCLERPSTMAQTVIIAQKYCHLTCISKPSEPNVKTSRLSSSPIPV